MRPVRMQRRREKGYSVHAESRALNGLPCVVVTRPGRWGNPYDMRRFDRELSFAVFRNTLRGIWDPDLLKGKSMEVYKLMHLAHRRFLHEFDGHPSDIIQKELGGRNLACYCPLPKPGEPDRCHAAIELELANPEPTP